MLEAAGRVRRLWVDPPRDHRFATVAEHTARPASALRARPGRPARRMRPLVDEALELRDGLLADPPEQVLLHGDFRQGTVLARTPSGRRGWRWGRNRWSASGPTTWPGWSGTGCTTWSPRPARPRPPGAAWPARRLAGRRPGPAARLDAVPGGRVRACGCWQRGAAEDGETAAGVRGLALSRRSERHGARTARRAARPGRRRSAARHAGRSGRRTGVRPPVGGGRQRSGRGQRAPRPRAQLLALAGAAVLQLDDALLAPRPDDEDRSARRSARRR